MTQQNNSGKSNRVSVPEAKAALDNMKYEIANELGVNLKQGYNGDLSSREAGYGLTSGRRKCPLHRSWG